MKQLLKYEFRKSLFAKLVLLGIAAVVEAIFLIGIAGKWMGPITICVFLLLAIATCGIMWIGLNSVLILHRDLSTKQSYMLFLTPHTGYEILGSKVLENFISLALAGIFFSLGGLLDMTLLMARFDRLNDLADILQSFTSSMNMDLFFSADGLILVFFAMIANWLSVITAAFLAVVLACSVLNGKKLSLLISFLIFIALSVLQGFIVGKVRDPLPAVTGMWLTIGISMIFSFCFYLITAYIMERKLSV